MTGIDKLRYKMGKIIIVVLSKFCAITMFHWFVSPAQKSCQYKNLIPISRIVKQYNTHNGPKIGLLYWFLSPFLGP